MPDGPVVASALRLAAEEGVGRVVVNTCHLGERMAEAIAEIEIPGFEFVVSHEDELMGTAGGLALARDRGLLGDSGPLLVINGDCALGLSLDEFAKQHLARHDLVTLALLPHLDPERWSRVLLDSSGRVSGIQPSGSPAAHEAPFLYPGVMAVHRDAINALPSTPGEIPEFLWDPAFSAGRLGGVVVAGHWREVGTPADYLDVMLLRLAGSSAIDPRASVADEARIIDSFIGKDSVVLEGAFVEHSIVAEGATIGTGARIERSVVMGKVELSQDEHIRGEFIVPQ
jgi:mannose-1-phosphate guanylyltransferase